MATVHQIDYWRQLGIVTTDDLADPITIIGAGGIGSPTARELALMGAGALIVYDDDVVDLHNLPSQRYLPRNVGKFKVDALKEEIAEFAPTEVSVVPERYIDQPLSGIVISGVDTMKARKEIWNNVRFNIHVDIYIEARMAAHVLQVSTIRPTDKDQIRWYEKTLYSDEDAVEAPCTERVVIYTTGMISSLIALQVKKFVRGEPLDGEMQPLIMDLTNMMIL